MLARGLAIGFVFSFCLLAQQPDAPPSDDSQDPVFGTTVVLPYGLKGDIYELKPYKAVKSPSQLKHLGTVYTASLNITPRDFKQGFPGITDRNEWFAIDYTGHFYVSKPGPYEFMLVSDDGSMLFIDGKLIVDNEGLHPAVTRQGVVELSGGVHRLRLPYFQGPRFHLALQLMVKGPDDPDWRLFSTNDFAPPVHPEDWKFGNPDEYLKDPLTPNERRRRMFSR